MFVGLCGLVLSFFLERLLPPLASYYCACEGRQDVVCDLGGEEGGAERDRGGRKLFKAEVRLGRGRANEGKPSFVLFFFPIHLLSFSCLLPSFGSLLPLLSPPSLKGSTTSDADIHPFSENPTQQTWKGFACSLVNDLNLGQGTVRSRVTISCCDLLRFSPPSREP